MAVGEVFGAFGAIESPQSGQIFRRFGSFVLGKVLRRLEISPDLVKVAGQLVLALNGLDCIKKI
jgi:hypothetical protein